MLRIGKTPIFLDFVTVAIVSLVTFLTWQGVSVDKTSSDGKITAYLLFSFPCAYHFIRIVSGNYNVRSLFWANKLVGKYYLGARILAGVAGITGITIALIAISTNGFETVCILLLGFVTMLYLYSDHVEKFGETLLITQLRTSIELPWYERIFRNKLPQSIGIAFMLGFFALMAHSTEPNVVFQEHLSKLPKPNTPTVSFTEYKAEITPDFVHVNENKNGFEVFSIGYDYCSYPAIDGFFDRKQKIVIKYNTTFPPHDNPKTRTKEFFIICFEFGTTGKIYLRDSTGIYLEINESTEYPNIPKIWLVIRTPN